MKRILFVLMFGMFVLVGCGGEDVGGCEYDTRTGSCVTYATFTPIPEGG